MSAQTGHGLLLTTRQLKEAILKALKCSVIKLKLCFFFCQQKHLDNVVIGVTNRGFYYSQSDEDGREN